MKREPENFELEQGLSSEEMIAMYMDKSKLKKEPTRIHRIDKEGERYYYTYDKDGQPKFYMSVTTMIKKTTPTSPHLIKWIAEMGWEESKEFVDERADYGTFMHSEIARLLIDRKLDLTLMKSRLNDFISMHELPSGFSHHVDEIKKDLAAFAQFVIDHNVKPLAIEISLVHPEDGYAGMIDLPCTIDVYEKGFFGEVYKSGPRKGEPKETKERVTYNAIVDFKSGRKGFYEDHEIQLEAYRRMWNIEFPDLEVKKIFNWSPKDWRGSVPTYNLKDQSDSKNIAKLDYLVGVARIEESKRNRSFTVVDGTLDLDKPETIENSISMIDLSDLIIAKQKERKEREAKKATPKKPTRKKATPKKPTRKK